MNEKDMLNAVVSTYRMSESAQERVIKDAAFDIAKPYFNGKRVLELGCSDGYVTSKLANAFESVDVVDGSTIFLERLRGRNLANVTCHEALFEDFSSAIKYDCIFATYVLEHVEDAVGFLAKYAHFLTPNGVLFVVVPNGRALSRQLALHMGLINTLTSLTENDIRHGHRRVYERVTLNRDIHKAGLTQVAQGGVMLKPFADFQMDALIDSSIIGPTQIAGLISLGQEYPDLAGALFAVCRNVNKS